MTELPINVCDVEDADGPKYYLTCLDAETIVVHGLPPQAIIGEFLQPVRTGRPLPSDSFIRNLVFVNFLHDVIARRGPLLPSILAEAKRVANGSFYVVDQRTPDDMDAVPSHDIFGEFTAKDGQIVAGSYKPNPNHMILTPDGLFSLGIELQPCLLEEIMAVAHSVPGVRRNGDSQSWWQRLWS